jgi:hypothetical protein
MRRMFIVVCLGLLAPAGAALAMSSKSANASSSARAHQPSRPRHATPKRHAATKQSRRGGKLSGAIAGKAEAADAGTAANQYLLGEQSVQPSMGRDSAGRALAFPFTAKSSGSVSSMSVYLDSRNQASDVIVGLYADNFGHPGALLTSGSIDSPQVGKWNVVHVSAAAVSAGQAYWIAAMGHNGALVIRSTRTRGCGSRNWSQDEISSLPRTWRAGRSTSQCAASAFAAGTVSGAPAPRLPGPTNAAAPVISGNPWVGQTLTSSNGEWDGSVLSYAYQWQDCNATGANCTNILSGVGSSYTLATADVGHTVRVAVTAIGLGGLSTATSDATDVIASTAPQPPTNTSAPAISGTAQQGSTLSAGTGSWTGNPTSYGYQWQDCNGSGGACANISGATSTSYTLVASDVGHRIVVVVTATNAAGSRSASSQPTAAVSAPTPNPPVNTAAPVVSGTAQQGQTLTTTNGSWTNSPTAYSYQWQDCNSSGVSCTNITAATDHTYSLSSGDVGHRVRAVVTATNGGGSASSPSGVTAAVTGSTPNPPSNSAPPVISGTTQQGQTLSTSNGSWTNSPTSFGYQWQDCNSAGSACANIGGATGSSYTLTAGDVGHTIVVVVTATNAGGSASSTSNATGVVTALANPAPPSNTSAPVVSGTPQQGQTLSTSNGSWTNSPTSFGYQWQDCNSSGSACANISGATHSTYALTANDVGHTVLAAVTATNAAGSGSASSAATAAITPTSNPANCSATVSSVASAQTAVSSASDGAVVCVTAGSYGSLSLTRSGSSHSSNVTIEPDPLQSPTGAGKVTFGSIDLNGNYITVHDFYVTGGVNVNNSASNDIIDHNDVSNPSCGYGIGVYGVYSNNNWSSVATNDTISGNRVHNTGTNCEGDALRADGFRNLTVTGNELAGIVESETACGGGPCHTDTFQTYDANSPMSGLTMSKNYIHDGVNTQGFAFLKDGDISNITISDNLSLRMKSVGEVTGVEIAENTVGVTVTNNTYQSTSGSVAQAIGSAQNPSLILNHNVFDQFNVMTNTSPSKYSVTESYNIFDTKNGEFTFTPSSTDSTATPQFMCGASCGNGTVAGDDYRLASNPNNIGIDWAPSQFTYGPA